MNDCMHCEHYRRQVSFVDAYKEFYRGAPRSPVMSALREVLKEETKVLESEVELLYELVLAEELQWPREPRFVPFCAASAVPQIAVVKNARSSCTEFEPAFNRRGASCVTCKFVRVPETRIGGRHEAPTGNERSDIEFARKKNHEMEEADSAAQACEIEQAFYGDGRMPVVQFLVTCSVRGSSDERLVVPFCNLRANCLEYSPRLRIPRALLRRLKQERNEDSPQMLTKNTIELIRLVAECEPLGPEAFVVRFNEWIDRHRSLSVFVPWVRDSIVPRWMEETRSPVNTAVGNGQKPKEMIYPAIAGCDAYEWGLAVAMSRSGGEAIATMLAAICCQQVAEFTTSIASSPVKAGRAVEAVSTLLTTTDLFATETSDEFDGFVRRLRKKPEELHDAVADDLQRYYEQYLQRVCYAIALWMHQLTTTRLDDMGKRERYEMLGLSALVDQQHQHRKAKAKTAGKLGSWFLAKAIESDQNTAGRRELESALITQNNNDYSRDVEELRIEENAVLEAARKIADPGGMLWGLDLRGMFQSSGANLMSSQHETMHASELMRMNMMVPLLLRRGMQPVTVSALELSESQPDPSSTPENLEEALRRPVQKTLEAFHAGRRGFPSERFRESLSMMRRIGYPVTRLTD